ncbi:MAG: hypothetical protein MUF41_03920 [Sphingopyxis sp.]|jgi:uncharacterized repeat protein (TIGR01451 family)|nr:hypothetical protein [Sphingopyxis sp.]
MTSKLFKLGSVSAIAIAMVGATPALAGGTLAGSSITNTASVTFQVGGVTQTPPPNASNTFIVDREIDLTVAEVLNVTTTVVPGQSAAVTTFTLQNTSNAVLDFTLAVSQIVGGAATHGGTDTFDVTAPSVFRDTNGNGTYEAGTDTAVTYIDELGIDATVTLFVVANVPLGLPTGAVAGVRLTATAREGGATGTQGAAITATAGANTAAMDTVFGDAAGPGDTARNGSHSDDDDYTVQTATLTLAKTSTIVSDPLNGTTNPKMIPGSTVRYCIAVSNAAGGAAASNVNVNDVLPANVTFVAGSIRLNGTTTGATCNTDGVAGGTFASNTVSGTIASVPAGSARTLVFDVTVN